MPNYSKKIVYLSKEQYQELLTNNSVTVNGVTVTYNENDLYVTPQTEPITDIKINNTSVGNNGIANIPMATSTTFGVVKPLGNAGIYVATSNGNLCIDKASSGGIKAGTNAYNPIVPQLLHEAVFYGLAKAANADMASIQDTTVGTYPNVQKQAIQNMLGITDLLSTEESTTATATHAQNSLFLMDGKLHKATAAIDIGDAVEVGTNCTIVKADEVFVKNTDFANTLSAGILKMDSSDYGLQMSGNNTLRTKKATDSNIKNGGNSFQPIVPANQHTSVYYALAKLAGEDMATSSGETVGVYSGEQKQAIQAMLGAQAAIEVIRL